MMPSKLPYTPIVTNSLAIRNEIQRFESVHPSIYAIYDLLELVPDPLLAQEIREHVVSIEDSFVNSQEWTFSRAVPDLRIGVVGSPFSGKSTLVHRYLTGTYLEEESPEGGRFKKEVVVDGQSFQLLIRDEGDPPEPQFNSWVDAVIFVFNLNNETSFNTIYDYYEEMVKFRNVLGIPLILVGTQDATGMGNQRRVEDARIRKLTSDLPRCSYYETCSMSGRNVERVFEDICQKICLSREPKLGGSKPTTPTHFMPRPYSRYSSSPSNVKDHWDESRKSPMANSAQGTLIPVQDNSGISPKIKEASCSSKSKESLDNGQLKMFNDLIGDSDETDRATQSNTPSSVRKNKRRSNLFTPKKANTEERLCGEVGIGRCIPLKKGHLYKKSSNTFSKTWNKRYVTLCDDGKMTYHPSLHDYMDNVHGKEIPLQYVTVKIPGQGPRGMRTIPGMGNGLENKVSRLTGLKGGMGGSDSGVAGLKSQLENEKPSGLMDVLDGAATDDGRLRKKFRRVKGNGHDHEAPEVYEFRIVSLDGKMWQFEAQSAQDRQDWVDAIDRQIMNCLQGNESNKSKGRNYSRIVDQEAVARLKTDVAGNDQCVDCGAAEPSWASLNLGVLMCIECSGIHRNLGSHVSRVRSLDLDSWTPAHLAVMTSAGNAKANRVWEAKRLPGIKKPRSDSSQEEREIYIRAKYEDKQFLAALPLGCSPGQALLEAICKADLPGVSLALCFASEEDVNAAVSVEDTRTPLHIASAVGDLGVVQLLVWARSDVARRDHHGRLAAWYARSSGARDVMELLMNAGSPHEGESEEMGQTKDNLPKYGTI